MKTEIIQAILAGDVVQFNTQKPPQKDFDCYWIDLNVEDHPDLYARLFTNCDYPRFRIKPEAKQIKVKLALMRNSREVGFYALTVHTAIEAIELETTSTFFVKWLTAWVMFQFEA